MNAALKEWASIVEALASGRQVAMLRKGGIVEADRGGFKLRHREFLLFPTYEHQHAALLQPGTAVPAGKSGVVCISVLARVEDIFPAPRVPEGLLAAASEFIWNEAFVRQRYEYRPDLPLWLIVVRAFRLPQPVSIPDRPSYAGCKSWVNLTEEIDIAGAQPVLDDSAFTQRLIHLR